MAKQGDWQIVHHTTGPAEFQVFQFQGEGWRCKSDQFCQTEEQVQAFVAANSLVLVEEGAVGMWPMRIYRQAPAKKQQKKGDINEHS